MGAREQRSRNISYDYTFKILTKNCKREQGSKGAELYHMTIISNQELGAREKGSRTISKNLFSIQPWTYWVTQKLPQTKNHTTLS